MGQNFSAKVLCALLFVCTACLTVPEVHAKQPKQTQQKPQQAQHSLTAAQAAAKAKARYGGTVLKVTAKGLGYRVKLLTDSGRVMTVMIKD